MYLRSTNIYLHIAPEIHTNNLIKILAIDLKHRKEDDTTVTVHIVFLFYQHIQFFLVTHFVCRVITTKERGNIFIVIPVSHNYSFNSQPMLTNNISQL